MLLRYMKPIYVPADLVHHTSFVVGASLSKLHTSSTALQDVCVCLLRTERMAIYRKFKLNKWIRKCMYILNLHMC